MGSPCALAPRPPRRGAAALAALLTLAAAPAAVPAAPAGAAAPVAEGEGADETAPVDTTPAGPRFVFTFPAARSAAPLDGRLLLLISDDPSDEPRFQIADRPDTQLVFGIDVEGWRPGAPAAIDASAFGFPLRSLADLPAGEYRVQGLLHRYETFHRADGHVVKLPMDRGEGQQWNLAPGNLLSEPKTVALDPARPATVEIALDHEIPPIEPPADTRYIRHVKMPSELLTRFWGRPMELGAVVLLPYGYDEHPEARYPLAILHGHFPRTFGGFREEPPDSDLPPPDWEWLREHCPNGHGPDCDAHGYERVKQEHAHAFYRWWTGPEAPRVIAVQIQHANPYYDDSYAVNSANLGPYGDAITHELIPWLEARFRGLGPWARGLYGGSTGGWEALAAQIFYPDDYNGAWASCPDPVDFRAYTLVDVYADANAYRAGGGWLRTPRPGHRDRLGRVSVTLEMQNRLELALGTRARSGGQWDVWQAVYGPAGDDGYPRPIWDKETGAIDPEVAAFWRERYDLRAILERDWPELGPRLAGKLHLYVGTMDNYYLNNAVYLMERFLASTTDPPYGGEVRYGDRHEHCWSGDPDHPNFLSRLTYHQRFIPKMVARFLATAPAGADVASWRY